MSASTTMFKPPAAPSTTTLPSLREKENAMKAGKWTKNNLASDNNPTAARPVSQPAFTGLFLSLIVSLVITLGHDYVT